VGRSGEQVLDIESDQAWLAGLRSLNEVTAAAGQPLMGNLFYLHQQDDYLASPPNPVLRLKRDRMRSALRDRRRLLEVGVNGGHSAYLALTSNAELEFHGVDICEWSYVQPAVEWLQSNFPGRVHLHAGDSMKVLPALVKSGLTFDAFHIDGAKWAYAHDILVSQGMMADGGPAIIVVDDTNRPVVAATWARCLAQGVIEALPAFSPMPQTHPSRNEVGMLQPMAVWKRSVLLVQAGLIRRRLPQRARHRMRRMIS
jgi:Methyltransferase domain